MAGLYRVENPANRASQMMGNAANSFAAMGQNRTTKQNTPGPTAGGAVSAGMGGALAGSELAKTAASWAGSAAPAAAETAASAGLAATEALGVGGTAAVEAASAAAAAEATAATGAAVAEGAAAGSSLGPWGAGIGALFGIGSYLFS